MPELPNKIYLLRLEATLYGALMARNLFKSNVTWSSYPFLPPTGASGFLAALVEGQRWIEGNDLNLQPRALHHIPAWEEVWTLGAFPALGQLSRKHFRAHLGSMYNYEAAIWSAGQNVGKKLAIVEEFLTDELTFLVVSPDQDKLKRLQTMTRGRIGTVAKKGCLATEFGNLNDTISLQAAASQGNEIVLGLLPAEEVGQMPLYSQLHRVPMSSRLEKKTLTWQCANCLWTLKPQIRFRKDVPIFRADEQAISQRLVQWISQTAK